MWLPNGENKFEDMIICFNTKHKRDGQRDKHRKAALMHSIARQNGLRYIQGMPKWTLVYLKCCGVP